MEKNDSQELIALLSKCAFDCETCASQYLMEHDIKTLSECSDSCRRIAESLQYGDLLSSELIACMDICYACANECKTWENSYLYQSCIDSCNKCAQFCSDFLIANSR